MKNNKDMKTQIMNLFRMMEKSLKMEKSGEMGKNDGMGKSLKSLKSLMQIFATYATYASAIFVGKESNESTVRYALWSRISLIKPLQNPYLTLTRFRLSLGSNLSRSRSACAPRTPSLFKDKSQLSFPSLASLICLCMLTVGVGNTWGTTQAVPLGTYYKLSSIAIPHDDAYILKFSGNYILCNTDAGSNYITQYSYGSNPNSISITNLNKDLVWNVVGYNKGSFTLRGPEGEAYTAGNKKASVAATGSSWTISTVSSSKYLTTGSLYMHWVSASGFRCYNTGNKTELNAVYKKAVAAASSNTTYGTVSISGDVVTATPTSGYRVSTSTPYTISPSNKATVSQSGNVFTLSSFSDTIRITINFEASGPACTDPTAPGNSSVSATGVRFTEGSSGSYHFYCNTTNSTSGATSSTYTSVSSGTYKDTTGLSYGTTYYYWARKDCGGGSTSSWVAGSPTTFTTTCPNPTSISAGAITKNGATFTITDNNSPKINSFGSGYGYDIYWNTSSTPAPDGNTTPSATTEDLSKTVTGLTAGTTYYYWVRGKGPNAKSSWVSGGNFTTLHEYTLSYKETDGTANGSGTVVENATSFTNTSAPSKTGHDLAGFYAESSLTTKVANASREFVANVSNWTGTGGAYTKGENANLYLKWTPQTYTISSSLSGCSWETDIADASYEYTGDANAISGTVNPSSGKGCPSSITVTMGGSTLTPSTDYTWSVNTAGVGTFLLKKVITGNVVVTITAQPMVKWMAGGQVFASKIGASGTTLTNPGTPDNGVYCDGTKVFVGWSATNIGATPTNIEPTDLFPSADATSLTIPAEGKTYYAVFAAVTGTYGKFKRVTTSSASTDIAAGQQIAIVAYDANNSYKNWYILGINAAGTAYTDASAPSETSSQIDTPAKNYIWTISKSGDYWIFTNKKTTSKKIAASTTTSNKALNISTQTYDKWAYGTNSYGTNTFYLRQYGSSALTDNGLERYGGSWKIYEGSYDSGNAFQLKFYVPDYTASGYVTTCGTTYTVTKAGSGTVTGGTFTATPATAIEDATITLSATPSADYRFDSWTITNTDTDDDLTSSVSLSGQTASATFSMPAANVTVTPTFVAKCQTPTFSVSAGTYNNDQTVSISCATAGVTIKYTTDGSDPATYGTTYSGPVTINTDNTTLKAVAIKGSHENSEVASATYRLKCATPTFSASPGLQNSKYLGTQTITLATTTTGTIAFYYTTGATPADPTKSSTEYEDGIEVSSSTTVKAIATKENYQNSDVGSASYTITAAHTVTWMNQNDAVNPLKTERVENGAAPAAFPTESKSGCNSYTHFYGWAEDNFTTPVTNPNSSSTIKVYRSASELPNSSSDVTYYAVWADAAPGWSKASSVSTGDVVILVCESQTKEMNGWSSATSSASGYGTCTSYSTSPTGAYSITVVASATDGYVKFHTTYDNKDYYLTATSSNNLYLTNDTENDNQLWAITFDNGDARIKNKGQSTRYIRCNTANSPNRFAAYGSSDTYPYGTQNAVQLYKYSDVNCVTKCCTPLDDINGDKTDLEYNSVTLTWDDIDNVSSWAVTGVDGEDNPVPAGNIGSPTDEGSTYSCAITGLSQYTDYTFTITPKPADGYCDASDEVTFKTPCVAPSSLSISSTGSKWDFCAGESMTLTVSGTNVSASATYQWQKHNGSTWVDIDGAESASYAVASMAASNAGQYRCIVTNPGSSCDATTDGAWVRLWQLYINNGTADAWQSLDFSNTGTGTGSNTSVYLTSDKGYQFKLIDNNGGYFGLNSKTVTTNESNITLNGTGANVNVTSGLEGNYTFAIDYTSKNNPKVSITYPVGNQPAGRKIWFDKSVIPDWNTAGTGNLCWRIGKPSHTLTNQDNIEDVHPNYFSLVPGTDRFYVYETKAYDGFEAWSVANNVAWSGSSTNDPAYDNHGIYTHYHGDGTDVTRSTVYQKYVVGESGVTLVPTTKYGETNWYCDFYSVTKTDGMLKHEATITSYSHGTVTVAYTKYDGTGAASFTSGSNSDLAHRCILTITAVPDPGYNLTSLQVNSANFTSGNEHILSADATITAVFSPKTTTVTFDKNSGTGGDNGVTATYDADMPTVSVPSRSNYNFGGYYDAETDDNGSGTKYYNANGTSAKVWDKTDAAVTLYAQWTGDSYTISYKDQNNETYSGSNLASLPTSHTYGAATALVDGVKTGYTFGGWFDNSSCTGAAVTSIGATAITANTTYYAKWTETDYTVTMAQSPAAGASLTGGTTTAHYNGTINISTNVPAGYAFNGWTSSPSVTFADASATSTSFTMPAGDVTITANFLQTHSATFIGPDGSTLQTVNAIEGAAVAYSASTPETCDDGVDPSNYFVGWATNTWSGKVAKGSIVPTFYDIANGDNLPNMGASDVTYYAVFAKRSGTPLTENTYTGDFSSKIFSSSNNTSATVNGISWTLDAYHYDNEWNQVFCTDFSTGNNSRGQKVGSSSNWPAYMSLTTSGISGTITSVAVSTAGNSGVDATVAITVGGNGWKLKNTNNYSASLTNSNTAYEFTGSGTGSISIDWQEDEENYTNALYFSQVVVKYTTGGDVSYSNYMTSCATCVTPSGLAANAITESGATITWSGTSASGTEGFKVAWNTTNSVPSPLTGSNSADVAKNVKTYDITGLNDETTYYVFVQSKCNSEWSSSTNFTTLAIHDITFTKDNGTLSVVSPIGVVHGQTLTFPNVTSTSCGTFVGWKATEVSDYDNAVAPSPLYKYNGTKENITADESYQAVYRTASGAETNVTDNVTVALTGITGTYGAWSDKIAASAATYAGNTAKNSTNQIQMRSSDDSGIISTISGGKLEQVDVTWASNTSGRTVQIYGKATPYSATSDLYSNDDNVKGTLLGELVYTSDGGTSTLEIDGTYNYIGIKSKSGAAYATNIGIQWWGSEAHYMTAPTCNAMVGITASFSSFTYVYGSGPSATQTFIVSGLNLSTNPLVVTAPTNYEISKTVDGTYTSSVSYTPVAGKVSAETVYIRLKGGLSVGTYNYAAASGVSAASEGATTQKVALNGSVTKASGSIAFTSFNAVDHYEAEMPKGGTSLDVTLTVSVTGDGAVSYGRSPAAGSSAVPATTPTTTLHVTTVGTWTVTANLTAGTSYTSASTTCQVVVYYADHYYDNIHSDVQALVDIDMPLERRGSYSAPDLMDSDKSTGSCAATHYKFMGWISKTAIDGGVANDAAYKAALIPAGTAMTATGESYYAVWAELEE